MKPVSRKTQVVGRIHTSDGTPILVIKHVAKRYRERVEPELPGWPEALDRLRQRARNEGVITEEHPEWLPDRSNDRQPNRWLIFAYHGCDIDHECEPIYCHTCEAHGAAWLKTECAIPLRGRQNPKAITVMTP